MSYSKNSLYNPEEDKFLKASLFDTRKPKLTLKSINKLKKIRASKKLSQIKRADMLNVIYGKNNQSDDI